jgi:hypothetical protein
MAGTGAVRVGALGMLPTRSQGKVWELQQVTVRAFPALES